MAASKTSVVTCAVIKVAMRLYCVMFFMLLWYFPRSRKKLHGDNTG